MYAIQGKFISMHPAGSYKTIVATFGSRTKALEYLNKSKIKRPTKYGYKFKKNSLLRLCINATVIKYISPIPHNPEFNQNE